MNAPAGFPPRVNKVPRLRDVWQFEFAPSKGKETPDIHPGVVMSELAFNKHGLCIVVACSHSLLGNPLAVEVTTARNLGFDGFIHADRIRTIAFADRVVGTTRLGTLPDDLYDDVLSRLATILDPLQRIFRQA